MSEHFISRDDAERDLLAAAAYLGESITSSDGHAEAMLAVVPMYLERGEVDVAAELANTVDDPFTRDKLLTVVAEKCAEIDDDEYALQLADAIEDEGLRSKAFELIGIKKASAGQIDKARAIAAEITHPDAVVSAIAVSCAASGDWAGASEAVGELEFPTDRVHTLLELAASAVRGGQTEIAAEKLDEAATAADEIEHREEKIRSLIEIGEHFIEASRNDLAIAVLDTAKRAAEALDNVHRDNFLAAISLGFMRAGSPDFSSRSLDLIGDKTQEASCLLGRAREQWRREQHDEALASLEESCAVLRSQREAETRNTKAKMALFGSIAVQFAGFGKGERAIEIAQGIEYEGERDEALTQIASLLTAEGEDERARDALRSMPDDASRAFALIVMSDAKEKRNERVAALEMLDEAMHLVDAVPQLTLRSNAYNEIARRLSNYGETARAADVAAMNLSTIMSVRDESSRVTLLTALSASPTAAAIGRESYLNSGLDGLLAAASRG